MLTQSIFKASTDNIIFCGDKGKLTLLKMAMD